MPTESDSRRCAHASAIFASNASRGWIRESSRLTSRRVSSRARRVANSGICDAVLGPGLTSPPGSSVPKKPLPPTYQGASYVPPREEGPGLGSNRMDLRKEPGAAPPITGRWTTFAQSGNFLACLAAERLLVVAVANGASRLRGDREAPGYDLPGTRGSAGPSFRTPCA